MPLLTIPRRGAVLAAAVALAAAILPAGGQPARAEVRALYETDGSALFSIAAPDGWVITTGGSDGPGGAPRILGLTPEDDLSLWVGFLSPAEPKTLEETEAYVKDMGRSLVTGSRVERVSDERLGTLPARFYIGQGTREGAPVDFGVAIAALPDAASASGPRAVICVIVGEYGAREAYGEEIAAILASLQAEGEGQ